MWLELFVFVKNRSGRDRMLNQNSESKTFVVEFAIISETQIQVLNKLKCSC